MRRVSLTRINKRRYRSMHQRRVRPISLVTAAAIPYVLALSQPLLARPPIICHPIDSGNARCLPWAGSEWRAVKVDYDSSRLVEDTLALLTPDTPVLVRMETMRRATVYAVWSALDRKVGYSVKDQRLANEL